MHSIFDLTRIQFLVAIIAIWSLLVLFSASAYFFFGANGVQWDTYRLIVAILSAPYFITVLLTNIFCVFRGEKGYDFR